MSKYSKPNGLSSKSIRGVATPHHLVNSTSWVLSTVRFSPRPRMLSMTVLRVAFPLSSIKSTESPFVRTSVTRVINSRRPPWHRKPERDNSNVPGERPEHETLWYLTGCFHYYRDPLVVFAGPFFGVRKQNLPDVRWKAHTPEGLVDNLPIQRVKGVSYVQAHATAQHWV